jgi:hypothetical protein
MYLPERAFGRVRPATHLAVLTMRQEHRAPVGVTIDPWIDLFASLQHSIVTRTLSGHDVALPRRMPGTSIHLMDLIRFVLPYLGSAGLHG